MTIDVSLCHCLKRLDLFIKAVHSRDSTKLNDMHMRMIWYAHDIRIWYAHASYDFSHPMWSEIRENCTVFKPDYKLGHFTFVVLLRKILFSICLKHTFAFLWYLFFQKILGSFLLPLPRPTGMRTSNSHQEWQPSHFFVVILQFREAVVITAHVFSHVDRWHTC